MADDDRRNATVYERAAWHHDIGQHAGSDLPYDFCPRCEMEHPLGRFAAASAENDRLRRILYLNGVDPDDKLSWSDVVAG